MLINVLVCTYVRPFETAFFFFSSFSLGKSDTCVFYSPYTRLFFFLPFSELRRKQPHTHSLAPFWKRKMLRVSRLALFIVPSSSSPELPLFLSTKEKHEGPALDDVFRRVMEYDRQYSISPRPLSSSSSLPGRSIAQRYFSGSVVGAAATAAGVLLFILTFAYNVGKPVVDAHRKYFAQLALKDSADDKEDEDSDVANPLEEFDDAVVEEEK